MRDDALRRLRSPATSRPRAGRCTRASAAPGRRCCCCTAIPQTHLMWHAVAPRLAERFTVVAADLPGLRRLVPPAGRPTTTPPHAKRALAADLVAAMAALGHDAFAVAGHDRGGRVAYRMALDHPRRRRRASRCSTSSRPARSGARADATLRARLLALGVPRPARAAARAADPRRPRRRSGSPSSAWASRPATRATPTRSSTPTARSSTTPRSSRRSARTTARARRSTARSTTPTAAGARSPARCARCGARAGALPRFYDDPLELWRAVRAATSPAARVDGASHFLVEDAPEEVVAEPPRVLHRSLIVRLKCQAAADDRRTAASSARRRRARAAGSGSPRRGSCRRSSWS